jgi:hypothetical protein
MTARVAPCQSARRTQPSVLITDFFVRRSGTVPTVLAQRPHNLRMSDEHHCPDCGSTKGTVTDLPAPEGAMVFEQVFKCDCGRETTYLIACAEDDSDCVGR